MKRLFILLSGLAILFMVSVAQATPSLGVAGGTYLGDGAACSDYLHCFSGTYSSTDGWVLGSSPATVTVFSNEAIGTDIWLMSAGGVDFSVGALTSVAVDPSPGTHWDGYITPYTGIDLGLISAATWSVLGNSVFSPGTFYGETLSIVYSGTLTSDNYFFLVADDNGIPGTQGQGKGSDGDSFSPKTTSSHPGEVPEPSMLLLFGSGLLGLGLFGRKKLRK